MVSIVLLVNGKASGESDKSLSVYIISKEALRPLLLSPLEMDADF